MNHTHIKVFKSTTHSHLKCNIKMSLDNDPEVAICGALCHIQLRMHLLHDALKLIFSNSVQDLGPCKSELEYVNAFVLMFCATAAQTTIYYQNFIKHYLKPPKFFYTCKY